MQNFATLQFKTRLGGEICSFDVNMHKGYFSDIPFVQSDFDTLLCMCYVCVQGHSVEQLF